MLDFTYARRTRFLACFLGSERDPRFEGSERDPGWLSQFTHRDKDEAVADEDVDDYTIKVTAPPAYCKYLHPVDVQGLIYPPSA